MEAAFHDRELHGTLDTPRRDMMGAAVHGLAQSCSGPLPSATNTREEPVTVLVEVPKASEAK